MSRPTTVLTVPRTYANFKRFWELVRKVRSNIQIGLVSEQAKAEARELFQLAAHELIYQKERNAQNV